MPSPNTQGVAVTCSFNGSTALGLVQGAGVQVSGTEVEAKNNLGQTAEFEMINPTNNVTITYVRYSGVGFPTVDDIVDVAGFVESIHNGVYKVVASGEEHTQDGYPAVPLTLRRYTAVGVPSATTTTA
jgi:hypothetical protein